MVADRTKFTSDQLTELARHIVRLHGGDPGAFTVTETYDGYVCVRGSGTAAFYPREGWTARFTRHLLSGYFTVAARVAAGSD